MNKKRLFKEVSKVLSAVHCPQSTREEFKASLKEMAQKLKAADVVQKDIIVSNLFLKLYLTKKTTR